MSEERLIRIEAQLEAITQVMGLVGDRHQQLSNAVDVLVTQFIRPSAQQASSNFERLERIEAVLAAIADQFLANEKQIAKNTEAITKLETKVDRIASTVKGQSQQIQVLIEENRADRLAAAADREVVARDREANERRFSEALAGIIAMGDRVSSLEQRAR